MKKIYIVYPKSIGTIAPEIYGHFTEQLGGVFYDGLWVGKDSEVENIKGFRKFVIDKLKAINAPVIRWPGGCFAETYDWRDGIGKERPVRRNWWTPNDGRYENNAVGTHEFMDFCEAVGAKAYFAANLTSSTPLHICRWMDYCLSNENTTSLAAERKINGRADPFNIPYWGVGNENWGGGGNMSPAHYGNEYRRYATLMENTDNTAVLIACGPNGSDYKWSEEFCGTIVNSGVKINGLAMHYYCGSAGDALNFNKDEWYRMLAQANKMEEILLRHWHILQGFGMDNRVKLAIDEWGCWHPEGSGPSKGYNLFEQQSTVRDAVVTALTLNIFNNNCEKIMMANVAQLVNNLHCLFFASGGDSIVTPTYHVFDMFKEHQGGSAIQTAVTGNDEFNCSVSVSASRKNGYTTVTLANLSAETDMEISLESVGVNLQNTADMTVLYNEDMHAHNTFEHPDTVKPFTCAADISKPFIIPKTAVVSLKCKEC